MKKKFLIMLSAALLLSAALPPLAGADSRDDDSTVRCAPVHVAAPKGTRVVSVTAAAQPGGTVTLPNLPPVTDVPAYCDITITLTHPGAGDNVRVKLALPQDRGRWNGRFQATGGSAYLAGDLDGIIATPLLDGVKNGYATAATDAGVGQNPIDVSDWALTTTGRVNRPLLQNFASRSLHDLAVVGKSATAMFYGQGARYAYWNGCSTGGRQGYQLAQDYPQDFQGILAKAPAISWDRFAVAALWSQAVFNSEHVQPTQCELTAFTDAAVRACDRLDGVTDAIIDNPAACRWDPRRLVGTTIDCEGQRITISRATAEAVRKIWQGPQTPSGRRLWYGPNKGANLESLASVGKPFTVADSWVRYFVQQNPSFDTTKLTYQTFDRVFAESQRRYHAVIGSDDPDLSAFARAGGKLLSWHGQSDQLVPTRGTIDYRERVNRHAGGNSAVDRHYRLFLLPGVAHCGAGPGGQPVDDLGALVSWVEQGTPPNTLTVSATRADGKTAARHVCAYPQSTRYLGHGDPDDAASYRCSSTDTHGHRSSHLQEVDQ